MNFNINDTINGQINTELWSSYFYLSLSLNAEMMGYKGIALWFEKISMEKRSRAKEFISHLIIKEKEAFLYPIAEVPNRWPSPLNMFKHAHEHEGKIAKLINAMSQLAEEGKEEYTLQLLSKFAEEQKEREKRLKEIVSILESIGDNNEKLARFDSEIMSSHTTV